MESNKQLLRDFFHRVEDLLSENGEVPTSLQILHLFHRLLLHINLTLGKYVTLHFARVLTKVHITHKTKPPYNQWDIVDLARQGTALNLYGFPRPSKRHCHIVLCLFRI